MQRPLHGGNLSWASQFLGCQIDDLLDFSASINPLGPPESVLSAISAEMPNLVHYPDPNCSVLRQTLGQFHGVSSDWILPGNGAAELLTWICRDLAKLNQVCLFSPGFGDYRRSLLAFDAKIQTFPLDVDVYRRDGRCVALQAHGGFFPPSGQRWGCILNDPHNPTGQRFDLDWIKGCLHQFEWVVLDEAFIDFLTPSTRHDWVPYLSEYPNLVILRSLTKFYSIPGIRIGYVLAHPDHIARWQQWRDPWSVNALALVAAEAALGDQDFQHQTWEWLPKARAELLEGLAQQPKLQPIPSAANYLLVHYDGSVPELQLKLLKQFYLLIRDCLSFEALGEQYFRVAVLTQSDNQRLLAALSEALS